MASMVLLIQMEHLSWNFQPACCCVPQKCLGKSCQLQDEFDESKGVDGLSHLVYSHSLANGAYELYLLH